MVSQGLTSPVWRICHCLLPNHSNPNFVSSMKHKIQCYLQNVKDAVIQGKWMVIYTAQIQTDKTYTVYSTFYFNDFNLFFATKPKTIILQLLLLLFFFIIYFMYFEHTLSFLECCMEVFVITKKYLIQNCL